MCVLAMHDGAQEGCISEAILGMNSYPWVLKELEDGGIIPGKDPHHKGCHNWTENGRSG